MATAGRRWRIGVGTSQRESLQLTRVTGQRPKVGELEIYKLQQGTDTRRRSRSRGMELILSRIGPALAAFRAYASRRRASGCVDDMSQRIWRDTLALVRLVVPMVPSSPITDPSQSSIRHVLSHSLTHSLTLRELVCVPLSLTPCLRCVALRCPPSHYRTFLQMWH